jgi:hypothetical protein
MPTCSEMGRTPRSRRGWARLLIASVLAALAACALMSLPYSTCIIEQVELADAGGAQRPDPNFHLGALRWEVSRYAIDPKLEPLRAYYRALADGEKGLEAARLITEGIASRSSIGEPSQEFFNPGFDPVASFLRQIGGEPGHCTTRSGSVAAILLAAGIPARVIQIIPIDPNGHLRLEDGHNVLEVWDDRYGWSLVDPTFGGMVVGTRGRPCSAIAMMRNPQIATTLSNMNGLNFLSHNSYYNKLVNGYCVLLPEPWLYVRSGTRAAQRPFRGRYVCVGPRHWQLGPAQKLLLVIINILLIYIIIEIVTFSAVALFRLLGWPVPGLFRGARSRQYAAG